MKRLFLILTIALSAVGAWGVQPERGYRGFIDWSNFLDIDFSFLNGHGGSTTIYTGFTTSHGYQFNPWLYVGGGAGFEYNTNWKNDRNNDGESRFIVPVFAEARLDGKWGRFTPFFSAQLGANVADHGGIYFSPTIGYRFNWGCKSAINLGLGATVFGHRYTSPEHIVLPEGGIIEGPDQHYHGTAVKFTARLGFEFRLP